ncbi:hypothetical protein WEU32_14860 (plasmid) [Brevundimonas sp. BH3]|uniref:hypothetical protein n=1 Tax=Brevundimonas sp. BH3 TaxID=3133089 RepID=UPI003158A9D7
MAQIASDDMAKAIRRLLDGHSVEINCWSFGFLDGYVWATNPYGIDVAFFEPTPEKLERALMLAESDCD